MSVTVDELELKLTATPAAAIKKLDAMNSCLSRLGDVAKRGAPSISGIGTSFVEVAAKATAAYLVLSRIAKGIKRWVDVSNDYQENLNLFTVAMGEYAAGAKEYAERVESALGIDSAEWMRNQGVFQQIAAGFGIAGEKAAFMSKNLTQLSYDLASLYNADVKTTAEKLQSAMTGQVKPLLEYGIVTNQARLQEIAFANGIHQTVSALTKGDQALLTFQAIMQQTTNAQGDFAATLAAPANQLRILKSAAARASRALGDIFIPALNSILPYAIAFLNVIRTVANAIANLFGFQLTDVEYDLGGAAGAASSIEDSLGGAGGAAKDAAKSAKELRDCLMGIDELNVINIPEAGAGGSGGGGGAGGGALSQLENMQLTGYDWLLENALTAKIQTITDKFKELLQWLNPIGEAIKDLAGGVKDFAEKVSEMVANSGALKTLETGFTDIRDALADVIKCIGDIFKDKTFQSLMAGLIAGALDAVGTALSGVADGIRFILSLLKLDIPGAFGNLKILFIRIGAYLAEWFYLIRLVFDSTMISIARRILEWIKGLAELLNLDKVVDIANKALNGLDDRLQAIQGEYEVKIALNDAMANERIAAITNSINDLPKHTLITIETQYITSYGTAKTVGGRGKTVTEHITPFARGGIIQAARGGIIPAAAGGARFNRGQLFVAREAGPELVAGIGGGRTAVMNNNQIVESVSDGVYRAMVDALSTQQTEQGDTIIYIGDKEIFRASQRGARAAGYNMTSPEFAR